MRHARCHTLAIALVAVALCADRSMAAGTASHRPQAQTLTGQLVRKLQIRFRRIIRAIDPIRLRDVLIAAVQPIRFASVEACLPVLAVTTLESRLPPPAC